MNPVWISQTRTVLSRLAEATFLASGEKTAEQTISSHFPTNVDLKFGVTLNGTANLVFALGEEVETGMALLAIFSGGKIDCCDFEF